MDPVGGVVAFLLIWWVVLFTMLPIGVRGQWEEGGAKAGTDPGAPVAPRLWRKALWTTLIAAVLWGLLEAALLIGLIPIDRIIGEPPP
jgi:predicted secreted protein